MNDLKSECIVRYNDFSGNVSFDGYHYDDLFQLCVDNGVNMDGYILLGFKFSSESLIERDKIYCCALLI